jgi:hypothetical protein
VRAPCQIVHIQTASVLLQTIAQAPAYASQQPEGRSPDAACRLSRGQFGHRNRVWSLQIPALKRQGHIEWPRPTNAVPSRPGPAHGAGGGAKGWRENHGTHAKTVMPQCFRP